MFNKPNRHRSTWKDLRKDGEYTAAYVEVLISVGKNGDPINITDLKSSDFTGIKNISVAKIYFDPDTENVHEICMAAKILFGQQSFYPPEFFIRKINLI